MSDCTWKPKCCICIHQGDPMKARVADTIVHERHVCTGHSLLMDQAGDIWTALAEMRRYPQRWAV